MTRKGGIFALACYLFFCWPTTTHASPPPVTTSTSVSATIPFPNSNLTVTGYAFPGAMVTFIINGSVVGTAIANSDSLFEKTILSLTPGVVKVSFYASDSSGRTTPTLSFETNMTGGVDLTLSGFLLPPTMTVTKKTQLRPDSQIVQGMTKNNASVTAFFGDSLSKVTTADSSGNWQAKLTDTLHLGQHSANALVQDSGGNQSNLTASIAFDVIPSSDLNVDTRVNLTDFSIMMFNYARSGFPNKAADINDNGAVNLVDFSVMMFNWTGN